MNSHRSNYLHRRITPTDREIHDRAFLRTLIFLIAICVLAMIIGKAEGYGQPIGQPGGQDEPKTPVTAPVPPQSTPASAKASPEHGQPAAKPKPVEAKSNPYTPDPDEATSLALAQDEAIIAQQAWNAASQRLPEYAQFNQRVNDIYDWCRKVIAKHKWDRDGDGKPTGVTCNVNVKPVEFGKQSTPAAAAK
jgi:hypothetical protein